MVNWTQSAMQQQSVMHNMSESQWRNVSSNESMEMVVHVEYDDNNSLIYDFGDNAPYVGLRKVDSLIQYLLVCRCASGRDFGSKLVSNVDLYSAFI